MFYSSGPTGGKRIHRKFQWAAARRMSEREWFVSLAEARQKLAKFRAHYHHERPHSSLADRTPAAFAELHRRVTEKTSTSMGRAVQSLFIESLDRAQPASNQVILTVETEK